MVRMLYLFALMLFVSAGTAHAAMTIYTDKAAFLAAVMAPATDTFNDLPLDVQGSNQQLTPSPVTRTNGTYAYTVASDPSGFFVVGTPSDSQLSANSNNDTITFYNFSSGISAIGGYFFNTDANGAFTTDGELTLSITDDFDTLVATLAPVEPTEFVGVISTGQIAELSLLSSVPANPNGFGPFVYPTVNDLVIAAVPEPNTWATLIFGFGVIGGALRIRKRMVLGALV